MNPAPVPGPVASGGRSRFAQTRGSGILSSPELCQKVRFRQSTCRRCADICPEQAISLDPGPRISEHCSGCGLCVRACPTEVFESELYPDRYLLDRVVFLLDDSERTGDGTELSFFCQKADGPSRYAVGVPCLGVVGENALYGAALAGFENVTLIAGDCEHCHLKPAEDLFRGAIKRAEALAMGTGLDAVSFTQVEREKEKHAPLGRRRMLSRMAQRFKTGVRTIASEERTDAREKVPTQPRPERDRGAGGSPERTLLRSLLCSRRIKGARPIAYDRELPWAKIRVDEARCSACGICVAVCPTGAFDASSNGECQTLLFRSSACTNCSLCRDACAVDAITFEAEFRIADILQDTTEVVATITSDWCTICGDEIPVGMGAVCTPCQRRRQIPAHLKGKRNDERIL